MPNINENETRRKTKRDGFTKIPHGFYERLRELKGVRLAVWLAHRSMESRDGTSFPSLETLAQCTGYAKTQVKTARQWLRKHGWLISSGQKHTPKGRFSVPTERTAIPAVALKPDHGAPSTAARKLDHGEVPTAARKAGDDLKPDPEVNTKILKPEVATRSIARPTPEVELPGGVSSEDVNAYIKARKKKPTLEAVAQYLWLLKDKLGEDPKERILFAIQSGATLQPTPGNSPADPPPAPAQEHCDEPVDKYHDLMCRCDECVAEAVERYFQHRTTLAHDPEAIARLEASYEKGYPDAWKKIKATLN
jgi:hypothetical protein